MIFCDPRVRAAQTDWDGIARFVVAAFRADVARAGAGARVKALVDEMSRISPEFQAIWAENDVRNHYSDIAKSLRHPLAGVIALEYIAFAVDGRTDLDMVVYSPATPQDRERIERLLAGEMNPSA